MNNVQSWRPDSTDSEYGTIIGFYVHRNKHSYFIKEPVPVATRSKAWVYGHSYAEIVGSNPTGDMGVFLL